MLKLLQHGFFEAFHPRKIDFRAEFYNIQRFPETYKKMPRSPIHEADQSYYSLHYLIFPQTESKTLSLAISKREYYPEYLLLPIYILRTSQQRKTGQFRMKSVNTCLQSIWNQFISRAYERISVPKLQLTNNTRAVVMNLPYIQHFLLQPAQDQKQQFIKPAEKFKLAKNGRKKFCLPLVASILASTLGQFGSTYFPMLFRTNVCGIPFLM